MGNGELKWDRGQKEEGKGARAGIIRSVYEFFNVNSIDKSARIHCGLVLLLL